MTLAQTIATDAYELGRATAEAGNPRVSPFADRELNEAFEKGWYSFWTLGFPLGAFVQLMMIRCEYIEGTFKVTDMGMAGRTADEWRKTNDFLADQWPEYKAAAHKLLHHLHCAETLVKEGREAEL